MKRWFLKTYHYHTNAESVVVTVPGGRGCADQLISCLIRRQVIETVRRSALFFWAKPTISYVTHVDIRSPNGSWNVGPICPGHLSLDEVADVVIESFLNTSHQPFNHE